MTVDSQLTRLGLYDARVPRYTSYPAATHFKTTVHAEDFSGWIGAIRPHSEISLYVHVPFCRRLCWFCACRTQGTVSDDPVIAYVEVLKRELELLCAHLPQGIKLGRLHWGGGTPTMLPPQAVADLARAIFDVAPLAPDGEFSVEIDPNEIDDARMDALVAAGMNRASVGVQDFDPAIQKAIGREQSFELTRRVITSLRARGITSLNTDMLFGLPDQTPARIAATVQQLLSLNPDRVAAYGYAHVPWMARRQVMIPANSLPRPEERLVLFETVRDLLVIDGYQEIGIDHFALPGDGLAVAARSGRLRRNFQGYTDDTAPVLVGLGASSISRFPQGYAQNAARTSDYTKAVREGRFSTARGHVFSGEDIMRARMIEALMCDFRIDAVEMRARFGISDARLQALFAPAAEAFGSMITVGPEGLAIPDHARPLTRMVARTLDAYDLAQSGHSTAI